MSLLSTMSPVSTSRRLSSICTTSLHSEGFWLDEDKSSTTTTTSSSSVANEDVAAWEQKGDGSSEKEAEVREEEESEGRFVPFGTPNTLSFRLLFVNRHQKVTSPWHNVPLFAQDCLLNSVCTTPPQTWIRYEFADEEYTPLRIVKDRRRGGKPAHFSSNAFLRHGCLPKTYQDPAERCPDFDGLVGCGKPLEVLDVGRERGMVGEMYTVKPLGAIAVRRGAKVFWTIIGVAGDYPLAEHVSSLGELEFFMPGMEEDIRAWLVEREEASSDEEKPEILTQGSLDSTKALSVVAGANAAWQLFVHGNIQPEPWQVAPEMLKDSVLERIWKKYSVDDESDAFIPSSGPRGFLDARREGGKEGSRSKW